MLLVVCLNPYTASQPRCIEGTGCTFRSQGLREKICRQVGTSAWDSLQPTLDGGSAIGNASLEHGTPSAECIDTHVLPVRSKSARDEGLWSCLGRSPQSGCQVRNLLVVFLHKVRKANISEDATMQKQSPFQKTGALESQELHAMPSPALVSPWPQACFRGTPKSSRPQQTEPTKALQTL